MALTQDQITTLGNHIRANTDQTVIDAVAAGTLNIITAWYNQIASPDFWVFKSSVSTDVARGAIVWTEVFANGAKLPAEERWGFDTLVRNGTFDPREENTRNGFVEIFKGADYSVTRNNLLAASTRLATEAQKVFASAATGPGGGDGSSQTSVAISAIEGSVSLTDISRALELTE